MAKGKWRQDSKDDPIFNGKVVVSSLDKTKVKKTPNHSQTKKNLAEEEFNSLLKFIENKNKYPTIKKWSNLFQKMNMWRKRRKISEEIPLPCILGGTYAEHHFKIYRLKEMVLYSEKHGFLSSVDKYLRSLDDQDWECDPYYENKDYHDPDGALPFPYEE